VDVVDERALRLRRNRDYMLVWAGQGLSELGSQLSTVAYPLLVLALTGSAAKAGVVGLAATVSLPVLAIPAGIVSDRVDRKRLMVGCDAVRAAALAGLAAAILAGHCPFGVVVAVAFVDGALFTLSFVAERGALRHLVAPAQLGSAVAMNESAFYVSSIAGPPLGGILFAVSRAFPFLADAGSYAFSTAATLLTRVPFGGAGPSGGRALTSAPVDRAELTAGFRWLWGQPLFRACAMVSASGNFVYRALYLLVVVLARRHGASSATVGLMFTVIAAGGLIGGLTAPALLRSSTVRGAAMFDVWTMAAATPLLLIAPGTMVTALVVAAIELPAPLANATIQGARTTLAPEALLGRVTGAAMTASQSIGWLGPLAVGLGLSELSVTATILLLCGWSAAVAVGASLSHGLRQTPRPAGEGTLA
jgi:MFS family permease